MLRPLVRCWDSKASTRVHVIFKLLVCAHHRSLANHDKAFINNDGVLSFAPISELLTAVAGDAEKQRRVLLAACGSASK